MLNREECKDVFLSRARSAWHGDLLQATSAFTLRRETEVHVFSLHFQTIPSHWTATTLQHLRLVFYLFSK